MRYRIVYYTADWCMPCQSFKPVVFKVAEEFGIDVEFVNIDDAEPPLDVIVSSIPTLALYKNGRLAGALYGSYPEPLFRNKLREVFGVRFKDV